MTSFFPRAWTGPLISLALAGCGRAVPGTGPDGRLAASFQALLDSTVAATPSIPGLILKVEVPRLDFSWTGAAGVSERATGERLAVGQTFRLASNTKTYLAAAVLPGAP